MIGSPILSCCCGETDPPCASLSHSEAPDTLTVNIAYELQWETNVWHLSRIYDQDTQPAPADPNPPSCGICGGFRTTISMDIWPYSACNRCTQTFLGNDQQCFTEKTLICSRPTAEIVNTFTATQSIQASGTLFKTPAVCWGTTPVACGGNFNNRVIYRGQIWFEYDFASDFPNTSSASGEFIPTATWLPGGGGGVTSAATGMIVEVICHRAENAVRRGMCQPYSIQGLNPPTGPCSSNQPPWPAEEVLLTGPHLSLQTRVIKDALQNNQPDSFPAPDPGGILSLRRFADGLPECQTFPVQDCDTANNGIQGSEKLGPSTMVFVKQGLPVAGTYIASRSGGFWPITRDDRQCTQPCTPGSNCHRGSACVMDPDRGPTLAGQLGCSDCSGGPYWGTSIFRTCVFGPSPPNFFQCPDNIGPCGSPGTQNTDCSTTQTGGSTAGDCEITFLTDGVVQPLIQGDQSTCFAVQQPEIRRKLINRGRFTTLQATITG